MDYGPLSGWILGVVGIIGLVISFLTWRKNRQETAIKRITGAPTSNFPVMRMQRGSPLGKLTLYLGDKEMEDPRLVTIVFRNAGNAALTATLINIPPNVRIDDGEVRAATIEILDSGHGTPRVLEPATLTTKEVVMPKTLLNPGDKVTFTLLVDGGDGRVQAGCKAEGFDFVNLKEWERSLNPKEAEGSAARLGRELTWVLLATIVILMLTITATVATVALHLASTR